MDKIWKEMYDAAKAVQNEREISDYVLAGGVAAAILSASGNIYTGVLSIRADRSGSVPNATRFLT